MTKSHPFRDRITELRRVRADQLVPHPLNWRTHPPGQQAALRGLLDEVGWADALLVRRLDDGRFQIIDGHLRSELVGEELASSDGLVPVLVLDVNEHEAAKLLATHDPLAALAGANEAKLRELLDSVSIQNPAVQQMLSDLERQVAALPKCAELPEIEIRRMFQVVVDCPDEAEQRSVFQQLRALGYEVRVVTI